MSEMSPKFFSKQHTYPTAVRGAASDYAVVRRHIRRLKRNLKREGPHVNVPMLDIHYSMTDGLSAKYNSMAKIICGHIKLAKRKKDINGSN